MLCASTIVYLIIAVLSMLSMMGKGGNMIQSAVFILVWAFVIQMVCTKFSPLLSWLLIFAPLAGGALMKK